MRKKITDPDVKLLATLAAGLEEDYKDPEENKYEGSPFAWIKMRPSRQVGKIGEQLVAGWCAAKGLDVVKSQDTDADRIIEGHRVEIKFSTLWESGKYTFQQIRNQNYEYLICLGISPFDAHAWIFKKSKFPFEKIHHQHGGARGRDTWWLTVDPQKPQDFLKRQKGRLREIYRVLRNG